MAGLFATACGGPGNNETAHPTRDNLAVEGIAMIAQDTVPRGFLPDAATRWREALATIGNAKSILTLGVKGDRGPETFGAITSVQVGPQGEVYVLDEQAQEVRIFSATGEFVEKIGGLGDGPTELRYANGMALLGDGSVVVSLRAARAKVFGRTPRRWELRSIIDLPFGVGGLCITPKDRIFVTGHSSNDNTLVHEIERDSGVKRSFAPGYMADHWLPQMEMGKGLIGCARSPDRVVFAYSAFPVVRAFDLDNGAQLWVAGIEDFDPFPVYQGIDRQGRVYVRHGDDGSDILGTVQGILPNYVLIQVGRARPITRTTEIRSYLIDVTEGLGAYVGNTLPRILAVRHGYAALFDNPYPRLELRRFVETPVAAAPPNRPAGRRTEPGDRVSRGESEP